MEIQAKPDYLIFADSAKSGEISDFPNVERGWGIALEQTEGKPPLRWFNSVFNRIDKNDLYILQQGVPEWDANVLYPIGAVIKVNSVIYVAKTQNSNQNPVASVNAWELLINDATTSKKGIVKLNSATNSNSETEAATPKAVKIAYDLADNALPKTGGTATGGIAAPTFTATNSVTIGGVAGIATSGLLFRRGNLTAKYFGSIEIATSGNVARGFIRTVNAGVMNTQEIMTTANIADYIILDVEYLYPNGAADTPMTISTSQELIISSPYSGKSVTFVPQIQAKSNDGVTRWYDVPFYHENSCQWGVRIANDFPSLGSLYIRAGSYHLTTNVSFSGYSEQYSPSKDLNSAPFRIKVIK